MIYRPKYTSDSKLQCKERCLQEKLCIEAFYYNDETADSSSCILHFEPKPCLSYEVVEGLDAVHWKASTIIIPTFSPSPTSLEKTSSPSSAPSMVERPLCSPSNILQPDTIAGYNCVVEGNPTLVDSNEGVTGTLCTDTFSGVWTSYSCLEAETYWQNLPGKYIRLCVIRCAFISRTYFLNMTIVNDFSKYLKNDWWAPTCCGISLPNSICELPLILDSSIIAGANCFIDDNPTFIDSNIAGSESACLDASGAWITYTCLEAEMYLGSIDCKCTFLIIILVALL